MRIPVFLQELQKLGYTEGKNIVFELRRAPLEQRERLRELAAELVRLKADVIVGSSGDAARIAKDATTTIPIVMASDPDPVANGFVASLARPGGNITGLSTLSPQIAGKQLELLKEVVPKLSKGGRLRDFDVPRQRASIKRKRTRCKGVWNEAAILRHTQSQRY